MVTFTQYDLTMFSLLGVAIVADIIVRLVMTIVHSSVSIITEN